MTLLFDWTGWAALGGAVVVTAINLLAAFRAIRAKERFRSKVHDKMAYDSRLKRLQKVAVESDLQDADLAEVHAILDAVASDLSEPDRRLVTRSLRQPSKSGERRYIANMLSAA